MKKQLRYALLAVLLAGLSGCGLKGPLYFPPADPISKKQATPSLPTGEQVQKISRNCLVLSKNRR
nr:lipoprotein [Serratia symbiotica]